jgi:hypothetical protein
VVEATFSDEGGDVPGFWVGRTWVVAFASLVTALVFVAAAAADKPQIRFTTEGQASAKLAVLTRADFAAAPGWTGGAVKPNLSPNPPCAGFDPKQSDLVVIGAARSKFDNPVGLEFDTTAQVLRSERMVQLDWQRTVAPPNAVACYRETAKKQSTANASVVSFTRVKFPRIARYADRFRVVIAATSSGRSVRVVQDIVLLGKGRTEITIAFTSPLTAEAILSAAELAVANKLLARARA